MAARDPGGRFDGYLHPAVMGDVIAEADARGLHLNDVVNERLARSYGRDPAAFAVPRQPLGRPRTRGTAGKKKQKK